MDIDLHLSVDRVRRSAGCILAAWELRHRWITRTVRQYERVDSEVTRCKVSYDISFPEYNAMCELKGTLIDDGVTRLVPLQVLERGLLPDFDISTPWPSEATLAPRNVNTAFATIFLLAKLERLGVPLSGISQEQIDDLYLLLLDWRQSLRLIQKFSDLSRREQDGFDRPLSVVDNSWDSWIESEAFRSEFLWLSRVYFVCLRLPSQKSLGHCVIKISYLEVGLNVAKRGRSCEFLSGLFSDYKPFSGRSRNLVDCLKEFISSTLTRRGIKSPVYSISPIDFDTGRSLHCRVKIPEEMRVERASVAILSRDGMQKIRPAATFQEDVVAANVFSVHCRSEVPAKAQISLTLSMRRSYFSAPAFVISLVMIPATLLMFWQMLHVGSFSPTVATSAVISLSSVVPAIAASYLVTRKEGYMISGALRFRRIVLLVAIAATLLISMSYAFGVADGVIGERLAWLIFSTFAIQLAPTFFFAWDILRVRLLKFDGDGYVQESRVGIGLLLWSYVTIVVIALTIVLNYLYVLQ